MSTMAYASRMSARSIFTPPPLLIAESKRSTHELMHARFYDIEEKAVEEFGRLVGEVVNWVARQNDDIIG
jgi:hypothetical protein